MDATVGRIVLYTLSEADAQAIVMHRHATPHGGFNVARAGDTYPAIVVRVFTQPHANLQVFLDGADTYWATSRAEGNGEGHWAWPVRAGETA